VASWDGACNYIFANLDGATPQSRALEITERIHWLPIEKGKS
jgi:hypothetical protein